MFKTVEGSANLKPSTSSWPNEASGRSVVSIPEGPSTQYVRTLVPKAMKRMVFGTRVLKYWVLGSSGYGIVSLREPWSKLLIHSLFAL